jgi:magnesium transporter
VSARWIDLLDPTRAELTASLPAGVDPDVVEILAEPPETYGRPLLEGHGPYVVGRFFDALPDLTKDRVIYREVSIVATPALVVTVRKTPPAEAAPWQPGALEAIAGTDASAGELTFRLVDDVAQSYFDVVDAIDDEIAELEEHIDDWSIERVRERLVTFRHEIHYARRAVGATRSAIRRILDHRLDVGADGLFPAEVERMFGDSYEAMVRASEELDGTRDVLATLRDHHQARIAEAQNDVVRKLTVIASLVLVPSFIVGYYGQNFADAFDGPFWSLGVSSGLIALTTLAQLAVYRWRRWI